MRVLMGTEGGSERIILCVRSHGFYLAIKPWKHYYRLAIWRYGLLWYAGRS